jgi:hypothetical protein
MSDIWSLLAETFGTFAADRSFRSTRFLYNPAGFDYAGGASWSIDGTTGSHATGGGRLPNSGGP